MRDWTSTRSTSVSPVAPPVALIAADAHPRLAQEIARLLGTQPIAARVSAFADGETAVRLESELAGADLFIVQPTSPPCNERLMSLALIADAARGAGAARITAVLPYFGYARQDARRHPGEPRSAQLAARMLRCAGIDRAVVLELHSGALESAFDMPLVHLHVDELMVPLVRSWDTPGLVIVSPDAGGLKRAQRYAMALDAGLAVIAKARPADGDAVALRILGDVRGRPCLIVDDMASTGRTLTAAAQALTLAGARQIDALFVHAVMAPGALERICASPLARLVTTDSVPGALGPRVQVVPVAGLLARAIARFAGPLVPIASYNLKETEAC